MATRYSLAASGLLLSCLLNAQWTHTEGPPGMTTHGFFEKGGDLYVGTEHKGVYKSTDHGATWMPTNTGIENEWVTCVTGDGPYLFAGTFGSGVFRSTDAGLSWVPANAGIETASVKCLLHAAGYLWAAGFGIYRSPDQGQTWENASGGALSFSLIYDMVYRAPRLEVEADNYLFYTEDLGENWFVDQGSTAFYVIKHFLQEGDTVLAAVDNHVFRTTDGLINWSDVIDVDPAESIRIAGLARLGGTIYAGYKYGVFSSDDWGETWAMVPSTGLRPGTRETNHFIIDANGVFLLSFEEIGVYRSFDQGATWVGSLEGLGAHSGIDNCITVTGDTVLSGTHSDGVWHSPDNGTTWDRIGTPDPMGPLSNAIVFATLHPAPGIILAGTCGYNDGLYRSEDNGATWAHITDGLPSQVGTGFACINALAKSGTNIIAATTEGVYYSTDLGITWNPTLLVGGSLYANGLATNGAVACVGISSGAPTGIYRSQNSGVTWTLAGSVPDVISIASDGVDHFYAGGFSGNYRSTNNGVQWTPIPGITPGLGGFATFAIDAHVFIGNQEGVWYSDDHGATFEPANEGMDPGLNRAVQGFGANDTYIYAGLHRNGIWRRPLSDFDITTAIAGTMTPDLTLNTWPDPATTELNILFGLPQGQRVSLAVFDMSGRLAASLMDERVGAGEHRRSFNVESLDAGTYLAQLRTTSSVVTRSLRIVR